MMPSSPSRKAARWAVPAVRCWRRWPPPASSVPVLTLGLPDEFVEHGDPAKLLAMCGLDAAGIEQSILKRFGAKPALVRAVNH